MRRHLRLPEGHFNPSILRYGDGWLIASRKGSSIWIHTASEDFRRISYGQEPLTLSHIDCHNGQDDPRLTLHRGKPLLSFAGIYAEKKADTFRISQLYAYLNELKVYSLASASQQQREKNWTPFSIGDRLFFVYSICPHVVLEVEGERIINEYVTNNSHPWSGGFLRGGTPPIKNSETTYLSFFHGNKPIPRYGTHPDYDYSIGAYEFEAEPPFRIVRQSDPLVWAGYEDRVVDRPDVRVVFPAGVEMVGDSWLVSSGSQDDRCELLTWKAKELELFLEKPVGFKDAPYSLGSLVRDTQALPGWCTLERAEEMCRSLLTLNPKVCVEVGVFGGRSLLPVALTLRHLGKDGIVYAVDPWTKDAALEGISDLGDRQWWEHFDGPEIFKQFNEAVTRFQLWNHVKVLKLSSSEAVKMFQDRSIDFLSIDGNHSERISTQDVQLWLPKVRSGGIVWMDDTERPSLVNALRLLEDYCHPYYREYHNAEGGGKYRLYFRK